MLLASGLFKIRVCPVESGWIRRQVPRAGLLGSLAAIALVLISFLPLLDIAAQPVAGLVALGLMLATLTARWQFPRAVSRGAGGGRWSAALVYYGIHLAGLGPGAWGARGTTPSLALRAVLAVAGRGLAGAGSRGRGGEAVGYLPVAIPLALATVVGGIDCTESAAAAGDDYPTGQIIAAEGLATLVGGTLRRGDPVDAVHRPPGLQGDGSAVGLHAGDGHFCRGRGDLRVFRLDLLPHSQGGDLPDLDLRRPGDHGAVVSRHAGPALSGGGPGVRARRWRTWRCWRSSRSLPELASRSPSFSRRLSTGFKP